VGLDAFEARLAGAASSGCMPIDREGAGESDEAAFRVMGTIEARVEFAEARI
jgi:hypothetical protein